MLATYRALRQLGHARRLLAMRASRTKAIRRLPTLGSSYLAVAIWSRRRDLS